MENELKMNRRDFIKTCSISCAGWLALNSGCCTYTTIPSYLKDYEDLYRENHRKAANQWFKNAKFGLFMHYGLYSHLGRGEWVMFAENIPVAEYAKLKNLFTAENFDADFITDLAIEAGMKYVTITSKHHDGFCLFDTKQTDFNSVNSPAKRDLMGELAEACQKKGLGLFFYYSYAADWKHPYFYSLEASPIWKSVRPNYENPELSYLWKRDGDFRIYVDFVHEQIRELLTQYGPIAGIWFDPIMGFYSRPDLFPIDETYALIRSLQPNCLISFKQGANGDEDFVAPERKVIAQTRGGEIARKVWEKNKHKTVEICDTLQPKGMPGNSWGYNKAADGKHLTVDDVMVMLENAANHPANLLLNTGPLPDGSIHPEDVKTLREVGKRLRNLKA